MEMRNLEFPLDEQNENIQKSKNNKFRMIQNIVDRSKWIEMFFGLQSSNKEENTNFAQHGIFMYESSLTSTVLDTLETISRIIVKVFPKM